MKNVIIFIFLISSFLYAQLDETKDRLRFLSVDDIGSIDPITVETVSSIRLTEIAFGALYSVDRFRERIQEFAAGDPQLIENKRVALVKLKDNI